MRLTKSRAKRTTAVRNGLSAADTHLGGLEEYLHMRWHQSPTSWGLDELQALGRSVSRLLRKPWIILNPVTVAVIDPRVAAARALVERWPMETVPATRSEYWSRGLE